MAISTRAFLGASALALSGCAYYPVIQPVPVAIETRPLVDAYPQRQTSYSSIAWNAGGVLGPCVASETTESPIPYAARGAIASSLNMDSSASAQFAELRTGARISCGYDNPHAREYAANDRAAPRSARQNVAAAPTFSSVTIKRTGDYLLADQALQCRGTVVMVRPESQRPGTATPAYATGPLKQFAGISAPEGYAAPIGPVRDRYGNTVASSMSCESIKLTSRPVQLVPQQ